MDGLLGYGIRGASCLAVTTRGHSPSLPPSRSAPHSPTSSSFCLRQLLRCTARGHAHTHAQTRSHMGSHPGMHTHARTRTRMHTHTFMQTCSHLCMHRCTHKHAQTCSHTCTQSHLHMHTRLQTCSHVQAQTLTHACAHTQAHAHTHTHVHTHIQTHVDFPSSEVVLSPQRPACAGGLRSLCGVGWACCAVRSQPWGWASLLADPVGGHIPGAQAWSLASAAFTPDSMDRPFLPRLQQSGTPSPSA